MKNIIAFGASNSSTSINKQLAKWTSDQLEDSSVTLLDLNDYEMPIYSMDREKNDGFPEIAEQFKKRINEADGIIISFAEYNGSYSSAFKNIFDWISRIGKPIWSDKPMFLMATSPGKRGGQSVLETAKTSFPHQGGFVVASFSLPTFHENFNSEDGIINTDLLSEFKEQLRLFSEAI